MEQNQFKTEPAVSAAPTPAPPLAGVAPSQVPLPVTLPQIAVANVPVSKPIDAASLTETSELDADATSQSYVLDEYLQSQKSSRLMDRVFTHTRLVVVILVLLLAAIGGGAFGLWQNIKSRNSTVIPNKNTPTLSSITKQGDKTYVLTVNGELRVTGSGAVATKLTADDIVANKLTINGATIVSGDVQVRSISGAGSGLTSVNAATLNGYAFSQISDLINASSGIKGNGTSGRLAVFGSGTMLQDALISQSGSVITVDGKLIAQNLQGSGAFISDLNASNVTAGNLGASFGGTGVNASSAGNGTLLIGNGGGFTLGNLAQGSGISITNGSGSVTVAVDSTVCTTANGLCTPSGGAFGTGTPGVIPRFVSTTTVGDSIISQTGTTINIGGTLSVASALQGNTLSIASGAFAVNASGAVTATGLSSSGSINFSSLNAVGVVHTNAGGTLSTSAVLLGTDTSGSFVANLGSLTGLSSSGNSGAGATPSLSVLYGNIANTAAQGNTNLSFNGGGNLTGSLTATAGGGITGNTLDVVNNPTFGGLLTANGGLSTTDIDFSGNLTQFGSGSITLSSLGVGIVQTDGSGVVSSSSLDRNSSLLSGQTSVANGGTGASSSNAARSNLGAASSGANSDITSLDSVTSLRNAVGALAVGDTAQALTLQGNASTVLNAYDSGFVTSVGFATPTANVNYLFGTAAAGNYTICTSAGNCAMVDTVTSSGGSAGTIALFTGSQTIGNSILSQSGTTVTVAGTLSASYLQGSGASITNLNGTNISSGTVGVSVGGTGASSFTANGIVYGNGSGALQVTAAGTTGDCLTAISGGAPIWQSCISASSGANPGGPASGDLSGNYPNPLVSGLYGTALDISNLSSGNILLYDGTNWVNTAISGDISVSSAGVATIANGAVTNAKLQNSSLTVAAGTGLTGGGSVALGATTTLNVNFGSVAGSVVEGDKTLTCPAGTGNLLGGGNTVTLGSGGSCGDLDVVANPSFTSLTLTNALGIAYGGTGATTASAARTNLGAASSGANSDITSLSTVGSISGSGSLTIGSSAQALTLQGNASTKLTASDSGKTTTLNFQTPTANVTYRIPTAPAGIYDICTTTGNCAGTGTGVTTVGGTVNTIALFTGSQAIGDSILSQIGTVISVGGGLTASGNSSFGGTLAVTGNTTVGGTLGVTSNATIGGAFGVTGNSTLTGNLAINGGSVTSSAATVNLFNTTPTTINFGGNASLSIGKSSGTTTLNGGLVVSGVSTLTGNVTAAGKLTVQGNAGLVLGVAGATGGLLTFTSGANSNVVTVAAATQANNVALTIPTDTNATDTFCLVSLANCTGNNSGAVTTVGTLDGGTANANGATINGNLIYLQSASAANAGLVNTTSQTFSGAKTFSSALAAGNTLSVTGATTLTGSLAVNSGTVTTAASTVNLFNTTPTTINFGSNATAISVGKSTGTTTLNGNAITGGNLTVQGSTGLSLGAANTTSGLLTLYNSANANTGTISTATLTANRGYILPDATGTFCLDSGNCAVGAGSGNYIQNQSVGVQTANYYISGTGRADTSVLTPLLDTATATTLSIGTSTATALSIAKSGVTTTVNGALIANAGLTVKATNNYSLLGAPLTLQDTSGATTLTLRTGAATDDNILLGINTGANITANASSSLGIRNIAIGRASLASLTTGSYNTATGYNALNNNATGNNNTIYGYGAAQGIGCTTGTNCDLANVTVVGFSAGNSLQSGANNSSLFGTNAGRYLTSGSGNTAFGNNALSGTNTTANTSANNAAFGNNTLQVIQSGAQNVAFGNSVLQALTTGGQNTAIGNQAAFNLVSGSNNNFLGNTSGYSTVDGNRNATQGNGALYYSVSGNNNVAAGFQASYGGTSGACSVANGGIGCSIYNTTTTGYQAGFNLQASGTASTNGGNGTSLYGSMAGYNITTGNGNVGSGYQSLYNLVTGNQNTAYGYQSGLAALGSGNVFLGYQAGSQETGSNKLYIANSNTTTPLIQGDFSAGTLTVNGTQTVTGTLNVNSGSIMTSAATATLFNVTPTTINFGGNATTLNIGKVGGTATFNGGLSVAQNTALTGTLTVSNTTKVAATSTTAFQVTDSGGVNALFTVDTTTPRVVIGTTSACSAPQGKLCVNQNTATGSAVSTLVNNTYTFSGTASGATGNANQTFLVDATGNTNTLQGVIVDGTGVTTAASTVNGFIAKVASGQSGNLFQGLAGGTNVFSVTNAGNLTLAGTANLNGGTLNSTATTFNLLNTNVTTANVLGAATTINIGAASGITTVNNALTVTGAATFNGTLTAKIATFTGVFTVNGHIISGNTTGTTTIAANTGANCSSTASGVTVTGNDTAGVISFTTGSATCAAGTLATVTFASTYGAAPAIVLTPGNAAAAALQYYQTSATANFTLATGTAATAGTTYSYSYHVIQ